MYEGMLSLMQMAKTSGALRFMPRERLPFISVLTNPTTAGVMASFASLGDVIIAEPKAMVGFAGPRVIKETTHQDLPDALSNRGISSGTRFDRSHRAPSGDARAARAVARLLQRVALRRAAISRSGFERGLPGSARAGFSAPSVFGIKLGLENSQPTLRRA